MARLPLLILVASFASCVLGQRITTIQLDGVQYFISRMNPYSPELNYFLAYQYCRSIGLQLASFETKEKSDSIMDYLRNAGYDKYDFWTSGNRLGADMLIWMSTGLPFNATFDYMKKAPGDDSFPSARQLGAVEQRKESGAANGCVALRAPDLVWDTDDCTHIKDFICEQTRCYYYNYGSIPVSSAQGFRRGKPRYTTAKPMSTETSQAPSTTSMPVTTTSSSSTISTAFSTTTTAPSTTTTSSSSPEETTNVSFSTETSTTTRFDSTISSTSEAYTSSSTESGEVATEGTTEEAVEVGQEGESEAKVKSRTAVSRSNPAEQSDSEAVPWSWARNIMLEKPVLKKSASL